MTPVNRGNTEDFWEVPYTHPTPVNSPKGPDMQPYYWLTALLMICVTVGYVAYITH